MSEGVKVSHLVEKISWAEAERTHLQDTSNLNLEYLLNKKRYQKLSLKSNSMLPIPQTKFEAISPKEVARVGFWVKALCCDSLQT